MIDQLPMAVVVVNAPIIGALTTCHPHPCYSPSSNRKRVAGSHPTASPSAADLDFLIKFLGANELRQIGRCWTAYFAHFHVSTLHADGSGAVSREDSDGNDPS
jgi:hypothetical protein